LGDNNNESGIIRKAPYKLAAVALILAAFICALLVNFGIRAPVEANNKTVGLMIDYDEIGRIANGTPGISFTDMLHMAYDAGATGIVVRERLLAEWEAAGDVIVFSGSQLAFYMEGRQEPTASAQTSKAISPTATYILTKDKLVFDQLFALLEAKARHPSSFAVPDYYCIASQLHSSERATLGMGFPLAQLKEAADIGFQIIPRLRNWEPLTRESMDEALRWVAMIPNIAAIGFNDQTMPGDGTDPDVQDMLAEAIKPLEMPLVSFEFYDQTGLPGLAARLEYNLIRAHAIADGEMRRYTDFQVAMDRYNLAATERNIRYIYLRFQGLANPGASMEDNLGLLAGVHDGLEASGLTIGNPKPIEPYTIGSVPLFLLGAGIIAAGALLIAIAAEPFASRKWYLPYRLVVLAGFLVWVAAMLFAPTLARKLLSMAGAIVFPSLSVLIVLKRAPKAGDSLTGAKLMIRVIVLLLIMSVMTLMGAMIISAILAEPPFMLKLDSFFGVKVSHIIPLILVPVILWLREEDWYGIMSGTIKSSVKYWQLVIGAVLLVALSIYILRTGNESPELVTEFESKVRQALDNILGVRPRTKEFLIGHPLMMILLFYGYKLEKFPLVMAGLIGQVSIINTYAHIHTPVMVSLLRSANGMWIGIVIGIVAIIVLQWIIRHIKAFIGKHEHSEALT